MIDEKQYLKKYVEGFTTALGDAARELQKKEHAEWGIMDYGAHYEKRSNEIRVRPDSEKGYDEGMKDAYATVGQDLHDNEFKDYSIEDYGKLYENIARQFGDCLNCGNIGSEKGCPVGKTIWCPRLLETLKE